MSDDKRLACWWCGTSAKGCPDKSGECCCLPCYEKGGHA